MSSACSIRVRGIVQGVGFRPFVYRLAHANTLTGWVLNAEQGVEIYLEGPQQDLEAFVHELKLKPPPAASIAEIEINPTVAMGLKEFTIRESQRSERPTVRISPDLPVCDQCLAELFEPGDPRYLYPYINCTNCGPRYSVILGLPYDRPNTTMKQWPLDIYCAAEYHDPGNRRFHAQPVACAACGPAYYLQEGAETFRGKHLVVSRAAELLNGGKILAIKGLGGYHLACDAMNVAAVSALRERKFRKERPFAVMVRDLASARELVELSTQAESLITSVARPIVLAPARVDLPEVAPDNSELGVLLPYTPLHHLLFAAGAPGRLVMTSANRSSEPIAFTDEDALERLFAIADAFLIGERPIARRLDDSVARAGVFGPAILRRARGYAPGAVAKLPGDRPILALGADLKNTISLVVDGQAFVSQHIGDLEHSQAFRAFHDTIDDLVSMYDVKLSDLLVVHDCHPQYLSTTHAAEIPACEMRAVQHHRAHLASVLAERGEFERQVVGASFDGTGYGDDGTIWGGEIFIGSVKEGFTRRAHLRSAALAGGDAAARSPVQAAAGFLAQLKNLPDLMASPFHFGPRYRDALKLVDKGVRAFTTTSMGRLFDASAALLAFTRDVTFEGQAAMWLEQEARRSNAMNPFPFPFADGELDFRPLLQALVTDRTSGRDVSEVARAFQLGVAQGLCDCLKTICAETQVDTVVLSGGVFQNELLLQDVERFLNPTIRQIWTNHNVPANDGGISLGQAALAAFERFDEPAQPNTGTRSA